MFYVTVCTLTLCDVHALFRGISYPRLLLNSNKVSTTVSLPSNLMTKGASRWSTGIGYSCTVMLLVSD